jgi:hypothetical protein
MNTPVSPKVKAGANCAGYATLILTLLSTLTPDSLSFLGHLAPAAYGVVVGGTYAIGAYLKADPLRAAPGPVAVPDVPEATATPAVSFAPTQAKLDALPVEPAAEVTPVYTAP